jgi:hypothetical protein
MAFTPRWQVLAAALECVQANGTSNTQAMAELCDAIAGRAVAIRVLIDKSASEVGGEKLEGERRRTLIGSNRDRWSPGKLARHDRTLRRCGPGNRAESPVWNSPLKM